MSDLLQNLDWSAIAPWLLEHGIWVVLTVLLAAALSWAIARWLPRALNAAIRGLSPQRAEEAVIAASARIIRITVRVLIVLVVLVALLVIFLQLADLPYLAGAVGEAARAVGGWLLAHGIPIVIVIGLAIAVYEGAKRAIPQVVQRTIVRERRKRAREELQKRANTLSGFFVAGAGVIIAVVATFTVLSELGLDVTGMLAAAGVMGIAIGFGAQSLVRDIIAGLFILLEDQYRKGDWVRIADTGGLVQEVGLRRTILRDLDGTVHVIPNGEIRVASNFTKEFSRANINISVGYGEDLDRVMEVINRVGQEMAQDPQWAPSIVQPLRCLGVDNFGDSGIDIKVLGDTKPLQQWNVLREFRRRVKRTFDGEGIEIPWPHVKLYFGDASARPDAYREGEAAQPLEDLTASETLPDDE